MISGTIYKGIGGFYYVKTADGVLECKCKGLFRKNGIKPLAGDNVLLGNEVGTYYIDEILPRKNAFIRPPVANFDQLVIVVSVCEPAFSPLLVDKMLVCASFSAAEPVIVVTKTDMADAGEVMDIYKTAGYTVLEANGLTGQGVAQLAALLEGKFSVLCGNSGVGKSTLLNALAPQLTRETGEISKKLGRGKHTTREVELFEVCGGLLADTPGFASLNLGQVLTFDKADLQYAFPEIARHADACRYADCAHIHEDECAVQAACARGEVPATRMESYAALYAEAAENEKY